MLKKNRWTSSPTSTTVEKIPMDFGSESWDKAEFVCWGLNPKMLKPNEVRATSVESNPVKISDVAYLQLDAFRTTTSTPAQEFAAPNNSQPNNMIGRGGPAEDPGTFFPMIGRGGPAEDPRPFFPKVNIFVPSPPLPRIFPCNCAKRISGASLTHLWPISPPNLPSHTVFCKCVESDA